MRRNDAGSVTIDPGRFEAVICDMDGVVTDTARVHRSAWKRLFDEYLGAVAPAGADIRPFTDEDYREYVDGRARIDGVEAFLASRRVSLPRGKSEDGPGAGTAWSLANRKNRYFLEVLEGEGAHAFPTSVEFLRRVRAAGLRTALVTASRNRAEVVAAASVAELFDASVDGVDAAELRLAGKPAPALFLEAARRLGVAPSQAVVVEDALAGVEAGRRGGFGLVIGVDRGGRAEALLEHGADVVVGDLALMTVGADGEERV